MGGLALEMIDVKILSTTTKPIEGQVKTGGKVLTEGARSAEEGISSAGIASRRRVDYFN